MREDAERAKEEMERRLFQIQDEARMANEALVSCDLLEIAQNTVCNTKPLSSIKYVDLSRRTFETNHCLGLIKFHSWSEPP